MTLKVIRIYDDYFSGAGDLRAEQLWNLTQQCRRTSRVGLFDFITSVAPVMSVHGIKLCWNQVLDVMSKMVALRDIHAGEGSSQLS